MSPDLLRAATGSSRAAAELYAPHLAEACAAYGITTPQALAAFLAQLAHESGSLRYVRELADGSAYEGRVELGNTEPGDGRRFLGRGLIQLTGRSNARAFRDAVRSKQPGAPDFEAQPDLLELPRWACWSAAWFWARAGLSALADGSEAGFVKIGRAINRGNANSSKPANGEADRLARWAMAKAALATYAPGDAQPAASAPPDAPPPASQGGVNDSYPDTIPAGDAPDWPPPTPKEIAMPLPAIIAALLPSFIEAIPKLGKVFGSGSAVAERNVKAAELVASTVTAALGAANEQDAVARLKADPAAVAAATKAVDSIWYEITEAGGGGIDGARKADAVAMAAGEPVWRSPSFVMGCLLLPLVYLIVGNVSGLYGAEWAPEARAGIAGSLAGGIVMGLIGYYYGQTTSRNRTPAP